MGHFRIRTLLHVAILSTTFISSLVLAQTTHEKPCTIVELISDTEIKVTCSNPPQSTSNPIRIKSQVNDEILGFSNTVTPISATAFTAVVNVHSRTKMIRIGNLVEFFDPSVFDLKFRGHNGVVLVPDKKSNSRFKSLTYLGYALGESAALQYKNEHQLSPLHYAYGIVDQFNVNTNPIFDILKLPNFGIKANLAASPEFRISIGAATQYDIDVKRFYYEAHFYADIYSNSVFSNYIKVSTYSKREDSSPLTFKEFDKKVNTDLQTVFGILLPNWDHILLGPKYSVEQRKLGGHLGYVFIWDRFHLLFGFSTEDVFSFRYGSGKYSIAADCWWRF